MAARSPCCPAAALALFLLACLACLACGPSEPRTRALLIGIDGAAPAVLADLLERDELPHLRAIADAGVRGNLRSQQPLVSPRVWNSVATGVVPERHGIIDFSWKDAVGLDRLFLSTDRKVPALWTIASAAGLRVAVVNWWNTYPPERVDGAIISDHLFAQEIADRQELTGGVVVEAGASPMVHPPELESRLRELLAVREAPVDFADPFAGAALPEFVAVERLSQWYRQDGLVVRLALEAQETVRPDLMMVLLTGIDRVSHVLWGALEDPDLYPERLRFEGEARAEAVRALEQYYAYTDALVGRLLASYGDEDLVVVMSDHGFEPGVALGALTGIHATEAALDGVILARGRGLPHGIRVHHTTILDVVPTVLAWLGLPVAADLDGRVAAFLRDVPIDRVESYAHLEAEHVASDGTGAESELLEQLRVLGYLE